MIEQLRLDHYAVGGTLIVAVVVLSVLIKGASQEKTWQGHTGKFP
jgi:hypothetical protein